ncbi:hypothetical protein B0T26DRAFT_627930, partial [Lasiosphaeria miniovina]
LGMADRDVRDRHIVDYDKSPKQVFVEATRNLIHSATGLQILSRSPGMYYRDHEVCAKTIDAGNAFRTDTGFIGFGPLTTKPGDLVTIMAGGDVPLVLRPYQGHYLLVGQAFVNGVMFGELFE